MLREHWQCLGGTGEFAPALETFAQGNASGVVRIFAALRGARLLGYCFWFLAESLEQQGLLVAQQGPWYCRPEASALGRRVFRESLQMLRDLGVRQAYPHYRCGGGETLGPWFERLGAKPLEVAYKLEI